MMNDHLHRSSNWGWSFTSTVKLAPESCVSYMCQPPEKPHVVPWSFCMMGRMQQVRVECFWSLAYVHVDAGAAMRGSSMLGCWSHTWVGYVPSLWCEGQCCVCASHLAFPFTTPWCQWCRKAPRSNPFLFLTCPHSLCTLNTLVLSAVSHAVSGEVCSLLVMAHTYVCSMVCVHT